MLLVRACVEGQYLLPLTLPEEGRQPDLVAPTEIAEHRNRKGSLDPAAATTPWNRSSRGVESSQRLGRHRWVVERTVSWLAGCRRLHRRYERKAEHFLAFVGIAAALVGFRRRAG
ncbi:transposase [Streptomyces roseolus]